MNAIKSKQQLNEFYCHRLSSSKTLAKKMISFAPVTY